MANETKGITVRIDAGLHAQVREYVESHGMTMAEFVSQAWIFVIILFDNFMGNRKARNGSQIS